MPRVLVCRPTLLGWAGSSLRVALVWALVAPWLRGAPVCELTCHVVSGLPVRVVSVCTGHFHAAMS